MSDVTHDDVIQLAAMSFVSTVRIWQATLNLGQVAMVREKIFMTVLHVAGFECDGVIEGSNACLSLVVTSGERHEAATQWLEESFKYVQAESEGSDETDSWLIERIRAQAAVCTSA